MTEAEWVASDDPVRMLTSLPQRADRKCRLFACACYRRISAHRRDESVHPALSVSEEAAEAGRRGRGSLQSARSQMGGVGAYSSVASASCAIRGCVENDAWDGARDTARHAADYFGHVAVEAANFSDAAWKELYPARRDEEREVQAGILRDIFAPVAFRPIRFDRSWLTPRVTALAEAAYQERTLPEGTLDNGRLAVLADLLEEQGCQDADILGHLRAAGPHVRGCWAVDLLLGKQ